MGTIKCNKVIAEFMGLKKSPYPHLPDRMYNKDYTVGIDAINLHYKSRWGSLMLVVEKIEEENGVIVHIEGNEVQITKNKKSLVTKYAWASGSKILAVYEACTEYINKQI